MNHFFLLLAPPAALDDVFYRVLENVSDYHLALYVCVVIQDRVEAPFKVQLITAVATAMGIVQLH